MATQLPTTSALTVKENELSVIAHIIIYYTFLVYMHSLVFDAAGFHFYSFDVLVKNSKIIYCHVFNFQAIDYLAILDMTLYIKIRYQSIQILFIHGWEITFLICRLLQYV